MAEADYRLLSMWEAMSDVQWLLMVVYHNLGMKAEEKVTCDHYNESTNMIRMLEEDSTDSEAEKTWALVTEVGVRLAGR